MDIKNLGDLKKLVALCRKSGIETCKISKESIEFKLKDDIEPRTRRSKGKLVTDKEIENTSIYTEENALYWSSIGIPPEKEEILG